MELYLRENSNGHNSLQSQLRTFLAWNKVFFTLLIKFTFYVLIYISIYIYLIRVGKFIQEQTVL
jgi:hypothetical protein